MKIHVSILLLMLLTWQAFFKVGYIAYWKLNQQQITNAYCENKSRPQMHCNGKCQLRKQLRKADGKNATGSRLPAPTGMEDTDTYIIWHHLLTWHNLTVPHVTVFRPRNTDHQLCGYLASLLRPPC